MDSGVPWALEAQATLSAYLRLAIWVFGPTKPPGYVVSRSWAWTKSPQLHHGGQCGRIAYL